MMELPAAAAAVECTNLLCRHVRSSFTQTEDAQNNNSVQSS